MSHRVNGKVLTSWDDLIQDAKRQIEEGKTRIARLRETVRDVTKMRDRGQPWPGPQPDNQTSEVATQR